MKWLMNVAHIMRQQNQRDGFCDLAFVGFWLRAGQHAHAERNHLHNVIRFRAKFALDIGAAIHRWNIGVMKFLVGRRVAAFCFSGGICLPKCNKLLLQLRVIFQDNGFWLSTF